MSSSAKVSWGLVLAAAAWVGVSFRVPSTVADQPVVAFGRLPVLHGGRLKPLDTVARTSLLMLRGKQSVRLEGRTLSASEWLMDMAYRPALADAYPVFEIDDPDVLGLLGIQQSRQRAFAFTSLQPFLSEIDKQARDAETLKPEQRSRFQSAIVGLRDRLILYHKLQNTLQLAGSDHVLDGIQTFLEQLAPVLLSHMSAGRAPTGKLAAQLQAVSKAMPAYEFMRDSAEFLPLPGARGFAKMDWVSMGQGILDGVTAPTLHPGIRAYAAMGDAWRRADGAALVREAQTYRQWLSSQEPKAVQRADAEWIFNHVEPFYKAMLLYVVAMLLVFASYLWRPQLLALSAYRMLALAFVIHTGGLIARMILQGRPPVTNLYSSAIFVGWAAVGLGLLLERLYRNGLGTIVSSVVGFTTLIIAHHLANQGDTLEMMRAVLDSNFWLATHVVCITIGYSSTFLSGFLAIVYVLRRVWDKGWNAAKATELERMVYGIVCFSTLLSFVGTILGGIWADQSWGRFWGWDPKENGALMIVLWNVFILHARLGGIVKSQGLMALAVGGNIVTAFSWFGVNMLGIGLHSYGFMDQAFVWLMAFAALQVVFIGLAFKKPVARRSPSP